MTILFSFCNMLHANCTVCPIATLRNDLKISYVHNYNTSEKYIVYFLPIVVSMRQKMNTSIYVTSGTNYIFVCDGKVQITFFTLLAKVENRES